LKAEIPLEHRGGDGVGGAADRREAELLALDLGERIDRRAVLGDERRLGDLAREYDLDRRALDAEREGAGHRRGEGDVDRLGDDRLARAVDVGETDELRSEPLLLDELAGLQHRAEADAEAARPIADLDLVLRIGRGRGAGDRKREQEPRHVGISSAGSASSEALSSAVMAAARSVPRRGCGSETSTRRRTRPGRADIIPMRSASTTASSTAWVTNRIDMRRAPRK